MFTALAQSKANHIEQIREIIIESKYNSLINNKHCARIIKPVIHYNDDQTDCDI